MRTITLVLSECVMEQVDQLASILKIDPADLVSFLLEGSTYLKQVKMDERDSLCP